MCWVWQSNKTEGAWASESTKLPQQSLQSVCMLALCGKDIHAVMGYLATNEQACLCELVHAYVST